MKQERGSLKPIGAWGYFGWSLLFSVPIVGFILLIVFSVGGTDNLNLRNFARSYWCSLLVALIFMGLGFAVFFALGGLGMLSSIDVESLLNV
jgi:hypothetical protein